MSCRYCSSILTLEDATTTLSYWNQFVFFCHKICKQSGERQEAIDCQTIDASCNDCKHFQRGKIIGGIPKTFDGHCLKFDKPTVAYPHYWHGKECFEHRRL